MIIPTAEEFIESTQLVVKFDNTQSCILKEELPNLFIQFAKLHVEAALKKASENAESVYDSEEECFINAVEQDSILNAYPLENIK